MAESEYLEFDTSLGERELAAAVELRRSKDPRTLITLIASVIVFLVASAMAVWFKIKGGTLQQVAVLAVCALLALFRAIFPFARPQDNLSKIKKSNAKLINKRIRYRFFDDHIESATVEGASAYGWEKVRSWGFTEGCLYIMLKNGEAILLDKDKFEEEKFDALNKILEKQGIRKEERKNIDED